MVGVLGWSPEHGGVLIDGVRKYGSIVMGIYVPIRGQVILVQIIRLCNKALSTHILFVSSRKGPTYITMSS